MKSIAQFTSYGTALALVISALCYTFYNASSFPYWDMWDGNVSFLGQFKRTHDIGLLFQQHNDHRILITRILFMIDEYIFGGNYFSLYIVNILCALAFVLLLWKVIVKIVGFREHQIMLVLLAGISFSLIQKENFAWAFQSQFFLAYLLPFAAYYFWAKHLEDNRPLWLTIAIIFLALSMFSMSNGIFATIPMIALELFHRRRWRIVLMLTLLQIIFFILFFYNYHMASDSGNLSTMLARPFLALNYILTYLGSWTGSSFAAVVGAIEVFYIGVVLIKIANGRYKPNWEAALILFTLFVFMTAVLTMIGRINFGITSAMASRYATPTLYAALCTFALMYLNNKRLRTPSLVFLGLLALGMSVNNLYEVRNIFVSNDEFERRVSTISVLQGTPDAPLFNSKSYPWNLQTDTIKLAREQRVGMFGKEPYLNMANLLNTDIEFELPQQQCVGHIDEISTIQGTETTKITGWIEVESLLTRYNLLTIVNGQKLVGFGKNGSYRSDLKQKLGLKRSTSGFIVYTPNFTKTDVPAYILVGYPNTRCYLPIKLALK
ncbi:MAG: glycosyltransferase family 39 protein [Lentilitoribacter sp.]